MALSPVSIGSLTISRLILGGNPFSGFSHQNPARDREMVAYFNTARIKATMRQAEALGITALISRADRHIMRTLQEYWGEGGALQWIAQTAPEYASLSANIAQAIAVGASAVYIHGGQMDNLFANQRLEIIPGAIRQIHDAGLPAGIAAHDPRVHLWARENLPLDFHMCSYYNPSRRDTHAEHRPGEAETFDDADRAAMTAIIPALEKPVIHYKLFAAGRNDPRAAFAEAARHLRPGDAVCIGVFPKDRPDMLAEDLALFEESLKQTAPAG
jgi:uncharacterized protein YyaL (SSP411 family)